MKSSQSGSIRLRFVRATRIALPTIAIFLGACCSPSYGEPGNDNRAPAVPPSLEVPEGNKVSFHAYAVGVQIYHATASTNSPTGFVWTFTAPEAVLYDADGNVVGVGERVAVALLGRALLPRLRWILAPSRGSF